MYFKVFSIVFKKMCLKNLPISQSYKRGVRVHSWLKLWIPSFFDQLFLVSEITRLLNDFPQLIVNLSNFGRHILEVYVVKIKFFKSCCVSRWLH